MQSMPVMLDVTRLLLRRLKGRLPTGVDRVMLAHVEHRRAHADALFTYGGRSLVVPSEHAQPLFDWLAGLRTSVVPPLTPLAHAAISQRSRRGPAILINAGHSGLQYPNYAATLRASGVRPVLFIHDLIPITHPEYCRAGERERHANRIRAALTWAAGIVTNSQTTLSELARFASRAGLKLPPTEVAPLGSGLPAIPAGPAPLPGPYFVTLGTIEPRKNHLLLLQVWRRLVCELGEAAPKLVVIGQRGWDCEQVLDQLERADAVQSHVLEVPACSDAQLVTYLRHARALLFPSFVEGFGMPLVEALALGVPVIASDLPAFREAAGDVPEYADPLDGPRWAALIRAYSHGADPGRLAQLSRLCRFRAPTWDQHHASVDALLGRIAAS